MRIRDRFLSERTQVRLSRGMQAILLAIFVVAVWQRDIPGAIGAGVSFGLTLLPAILERDYEVSLDAGLTAWLTAAVFLHAIGTRFALYRSVWWWDHLTHTLSATVVAAAGYTFIRALDEHSDDIAVPPRLVFVFVFLATMAAGVVWEVLEFLLFDLTRALGSAPLLTQHGIEDTMLDLTFDAVGAVIVATWGTVYLTETVQMVVSHLDGRDRPEQV